MKYKLVILGCGPANKIPSIEKGWGSCDDSNPKNRRTRTSAILYIDKIGILFDVSPDFISQYMDNKLTNIDHIFITHNHADHTLGINDLRGVNRKYNKYLNLYTSKFFLNDLMAKFPYIFVKNQNISQNYFNNTAINMHTIYSNQYLFIHQNNIKILSTEQQHGIGNSIGYIVNNKFAYLTDFSNFTKSNRDYYTNLDLLVLGVLNYTGHFAHYDFYKAMDLIREIRPKNVFLTHMAESMDYEHTLEECSKYSKTLGINILPAYDGLSYIFG